MTDDEEEEEEEEEEQEEWDGTQLTQILAVTTTAYSSSLPPTQLETPPTQMETYPTLDVTQLDAAPSDDDDDDGKLYSCHGCGDEFSSRTSFKAHFVAHHVTPSSTT